MKPRQCTIMGYTPAGMRFNSVSTRHTLDTFHVCYEVTSVNTAELRSTMRDSDWQNTGKLVDRGSVMEWSVAETAEQSGMGKENKRKNSDKIAISSQPSPIVVHFDNCVVFIDDIHQGNFVVPHLLAHYCPEAGWWRTQKANGWLPCTLLDFNQYSSYSLFICSQGEFGQSLGVQQGLSICMLLWITNQNRYLYIPAVVSPSVLGSPTYYIAQCRPLPISLSAHVACTCCQLSCHLHPLRESGWRLCFEIAWYIPLGTHSHQSLNTLR